MIESQKILKINIHVVDSVWISFRIIGKITHSGFKFKDIETTKIDLKEI
jgi:hypothetical protein